MSALASQTDGNAVRMRCDAMRCDRVRLKRLSWLVDWGPLGSSAMPGHLYLGLSRELVGQLHGNSRGDLKLCCSRIGTEY